MAIYQVDWHWFSTGGAGPNNTVQVNIPPAFLGATVALHGVVGAGTAYAGIAHYRKRHEDGRDEDIDFGEYWRWSSNIVDTVSSVTFGLHSLEAPLQVEAAWAIARMDYWR